MQRRCLCRCHATLGERQRGDGVGVTDPVAAVSACSACQNYHAPALLDQPPQIDGRNIDVMIDFIPPTAWTEEDGG